MLASIIVLVGLPVAGLATNSTIRWMFGLPQSATADLILVLVIFDLTLLCSPGEVLSRLPDYARGIYGLITLVSFTLWLISLFKVEVPLRECMSPEGERFEDYPYWLSFFAYGLSVSALVISLAPILYWS
jgi:hypothetical protein